MDNYLSNLAARTLDMAVVIQPRPLSLFESLPAIMPALPEQTHLETGVQPPAFPAEAAAQPQPAVEPSGAETGNRQLSPPSIVRSVVAEPSPPTPRLPQTEMNRLPDPPARLPTAVPPSPLHPNHQQPVVEPPRLRPTLQDSPPEPDPAPTVRPQIDANLVTPQETAVSPSTQETERQPEREAVKPAGIERIIKLQPPSTVIVTKQQVNQMPAIRQSFTTQINVTPVNLMGDNLAATVLPPVPISKPTSLEIQEKRDASQPVVERRVETIHPATAVTPPIPGRQAARRARHRQPQPPAPTPTISVQIGRIEVRATPPPASTPRPKRARPEVMGLDDYLQKRNRPGGTP